MDFEPTLNALEQFSQFFRQPIEIPIEKYTVPGAANRSEAALNTFEETTPQKKTQTIKPTIPINEIQEVDTKSSRRVKINPDCKCFFISIKPKGAEKGKRVVLFYAPPYVQILEEMPKEKDDLQPRYEMEVLPRDTNISFEGRFLFIETRYGDREFTIKSKNEIFKNIVTSQFKTPLVPFILSTLGYGSLPPTPLMAQSFLYHTIYTETFLLSFNYINPQILVSKNDEIDYIKSYVMAADPNLDYIISRLFREFFKTHNWKDKFDPCNEFPFRVAAKILSLDDTFIKFCQKMAACVTNKIDTYLGYVYLMPFNPRSLMVLHIIYFEANLRFPDSQAPALMVSNTIFKAALLPYLKKEEPTQDLSELDSVISFAQTAVCLDHLKRYEAILSAFSAQPKDYIPVKKGQAVYESFHTLMKLVEKYPSDFLAVARRIDDLEP